MTDPVEERRGAYVSWLLSRACSQAVREWCTSAGVRDPLPVGEHHCTVMYSKERGVDPSMHGDNPLPRPWSCGYSPPLVEHPCRTDVLGPPTGKGALVVVMHAPVITARNRWWRDEHYLQHSFPQFIPHVTLSYDFSAQDPRVMLEIVQRPLPVPLVFDREHVDYANA